jgi:hypothetical protein
MPATLELDLIAAQVADGSPCCHKECGGRAQLLTLPSFVPLPYPLLYHPWWPAVGWILVATDGSTTMAIGSATSIIGWSFERLLTLVKIRHHLPRYGAGAVKPSMATTVGMLSGIGQPQDGVHS